MADILVIDDDAGVRRSIARVLEQAGYTVHEAANGREGVRLVNRIHPALVISDLLMPVMEGIETIRELRGRDATMPILAISGGGPPLYLWAAAHLGATAALAKPFSKSALLDTVTRLMAGGPAAAS